MGRPEKPILTLNSGLYALAHWLRQQRSGAHLTYAALAENTIYTQTTLQRATSGERIPKLPVVEAYARGCGADVREARRMWRNARWIEHRTLHPRSPASPLPELVTEPAELLAALRELYYKSGAMPLDEIERRAGLGRLPHTTVHRMLHGTAVLQRDQLRAFLEVCEVPGKEHEAWMKAWLRVWRYRKQDQHERPLSPPAETSEMNFDRVVRALLSDHRLAQRAGDFYDRQSERGFDDALDAAMASVYRYKRDQVLRTERRRDTVQLTRAQRRRDVVLGRTAAG
ncbi:helix-turn-helix transcriptional regulator [Streptomyces sp. NPDC051993]|uniref:helix-turn-helix domain-containing protein n=1 Tax=Streptomyces sp. NPDC051993 TaxID=3155286 RepID=UPI00341C7292